MKQNVFRFLFKDVALSVILSILTLLTSAWIFPLENTLYFIALFFYIGLITFLAFAYLNNIIKRNKTRFNNTFFIITILKFFFLILFFIVMRLVYPENFIPFIGAFFIGYTLYTALFIKEILALLKKI